jgi:hypothetical protein
MQKRTLAAMTAVGLAAAIAIPSAAFGNARRTSPAGSLSYIRSAQTPYVARLLGANVVPTAGDPDGVGAAAFTFDFIDASHTQVCWDLSYSGITAPTLAHIHRGGAGQNTAPNQVVPDPLVATSLLPLGPNSATGCAGIDPALVTEITTTPSNFYVDVHTSDFPAGAIRGQLSVGAAPAGEAHLLPVPLRAYDSRDNAGPKLTALETRTISLATGKDIAGNISIAVPPGATGAIVTLTVTETVGPGGFIKLYNAALTTQPATSSINWAGTNQNLAVTTQVEVDSSDSVKVTGGANSTHFVIDVIGYLF